MHNPLSHMKAVKLHQNGQIIFPIDLYKVTVCISTVHTCNMPFLSLAYREALSILMSVQFENISCHNA